MAGDGSNSQEPYVSVRQVQEPRAPPAPPLTSTGLRQLDAGCRAILGGGLARSCCRLRAHVRGGISSAHGMRGLRGAGRHRELTVNGGTHPVQGKPW